MKGELDRGWNCMDPSGLLNKAFKSAPEPVHELLRPEPPQFDPGVAEAGGFPESLIRRPNKQ